MKFTKDTARQHGARGGRAKAARRLTTLEQANGRLTLDQVEQAFGSLGSLEDAERRLERIGVWAVAGMLPGSVAGAAVRSIEVWIKANESKLSREIVEGLRKRLDELEVQVKRSRLGVA